MGDQIRRKQNDTGPPIEDTLETDGSGGDDLTGATVAFSMWRESGGMIVDKDTTNVEVPTPGEGEVRYNFQSGDLAETGGYEYEWEVTFADGEIRTYPNTDTGKDLWVIKEGN